MIIANMSRTVFTNERGFKNINRSFEIDPKNELESLKKELAAIWSNEALAGSIDYKTEEQQTSIKFGQNEQYYIHFISAGKKRWVCLLQHDSIDEVIEELDGLIDELVF